MKDKDTTEQPAPVSVNGAMDTSEDDKSDERIKLVSFRELVPEIKDTGLSYTRNFLLSR